jgi:hypothetical protein
MKRMMRAAAAAAVLFGGVGSAGCAGTGTAGARGEGHGPIGDCWRNAVDPCYPERYASAARGAVVAPFAQQVQNGTVLNQTVFNYHFVFNSDELTPGGQEKLISLARTRPAPDPKLFIQSARDLPATTDPARLADVRADLDARRAATVQKFLAAQPAFGGPVNYEIAVIDAPTPGIAANFAEQAYRGSLQQYRGNVSGGGTGVLGTGGGGAGGGGGAITAPPVTTGGGTFGASNFGNPAQTGGGGGFGPTGR